MMSTVVWISTDEAKVFRFVPGKTDFIHIRMPLLKRHSVEHGINATKVDESLALFEAVAKKINEYTTDRLLILGPGLARVHFKTFLENDFNVLANNVVGTEGTDHLTDGEIENLAHKFFKKIDVLDALGT